MGINMLGNLPLSDIRGPAGDLLGKLAGDEGEVYLRELKRFLRKEPCWTANVVTPSESGRLLEPVGTVSIPATTNPFIAKDKFVVNTKGNAPVKISSIGDNFTTWFLSDKCKTEDPISEQTLRYYKLRESSVDGPIITALGGAEKAETTITEMFCLMAKQKYGEDGCLLNNGYANIFYIKDQNGVLRAVSVYWDDDGWDVRAYSVEDPDRWGGGCQVFSRNSVLGSSEPVPAAN